MIVALHYFTSVNTMVLFWLALILTLPLGAAGGNSLIKTVDEGGLGWGNAWCAVTLFALLVAYQTLRVRQHPLEPLPHPVSRRTGWPQQPTARSSPSGRAWPPN